MSTKCGRLKVVIDATKVRGASQFAARPEEWFIDEIAATEGMWFTHEDLLEAIKGLPR
jgi:hypothetical protein